ncbi:Spermatid perinuclear RNA-binding protein [Liparis tanakae]|uniref:Spermatid perinuclear RNA-binding protein n=1 Tax=Liparis tanakae TaxID=230148 RepID=A0A4Z2GG15_9TELE|nr:Spermatid perinuclear RNA-binding protein [Liparis tanakae]
MISKIYIHKQALQALGFVLGGDGDVDPLSADEKSDGEGKNDRMSTSSTSTSITSSTELREEVGEKDLVWTQTPGPRGEASASYAVHMGLSLLPGASPAVCVAGGLQGVPLPRQGHLPVQQEVKTVNLLACDGSVLPEDLRGPPPSGFVNDVLQDLSDKAAKKENISENRPPPRLKRQL